MISYKKFILLFVLLCLLATETFLHISGTRPGFIYSGVKEVDSLEVLPFYFTDSFGVQKLSPDARTIMNDYVQGKRKLTLKNLEKDKLEDDLATLVGEFYTTAQNLNEDSIEQLQKENGIDFSDDERKEFNENKRSSEFEKRVKEIFGKENKTAFDSLLIQYVCNPINKDGFHSIDFTTRVPAKKRILLLGDSFTWGRSAQPYYNSFADILLARGYLVFNTGIVSTDPAQYAAVLNKYIDSIQPDMVIMNFYSGNDKMFFERPVATNHPEYHHTNAGLLSAYPHNVYMNAQQAYECELEESKIPRTNLFNRFCSLTAFTTKLWNFTYTKQWIKGDNPATKKFRTNAPQDALFPVSKKYLQQIQDLCTHYGVACVFSVIPDAFHYYDRYTHTNTKQVFGNIPFYEAQNFKETDYCGGGDDHFNNTGHKKYAEYLQGIIDSVSSSQSRN